MYVPFLPHPNTLRVHHLLLVSRDKNKNKNDQTRILYRAKTPTED